MAGKDLRLPIANRPTIEADWSWGVIEGVRFLWNATRGHRLRPWRSSYLRWRLETFTGKHADDVRGRDFWRFVWGERRQVLRFLGWLGEMRSYSGGDNG